MREKVYIILKKVYGIIMTASFFAGILPVIPFIVAVVIGGQKGEMLALFLGKQVYPWIIAMASIAVIIGLVAMYIGKKDEASVKKIQQANK